MNTDNKDIPNYGSQEEEENLLYEHIRVQADKGQSLLRVDKFLYLHLSDTSRNRIQKAAEAGFIRVNDKQVKSNYRVKPFDVVTVWLDYPPYDTTIEAEDIPLNIVYEDNELIVVNKPAGMVVHPGCGNFNGTLVNAIAWHLKDNAQFDINNPEVGLVHRIDKDTSGLLVIAKTANAKTKLGLQFFNKTTSRRYNALIWGDPGGNEGRMREISEGTPRTDFGWLYLTPSATLESLPSPTGVCSGDTATAH